MAEIRLSLLDKEFYTSLVRRDDTALRRVALVAAQFAMRRNPIQYPAVNSALSLLNENKPVTADNLRDLGKLVSSLDNIQVDIHTRMELRQKTEIEWQTALHQARTAAAVSAAANEDPLLAAMESVYEAYSATEDWPALKQAITEALGS